ncbi:MAG TPA: hypothetical protein VD833_01985 [Vicinamibacterales bacterium]|nr:hypothetical protein [Vicinamibacterales bacterium]
MAAHLTDDDLVLHYYGEMPSGEERQAHAHLVECSACHESYRRLQRVLAIVDEAAVAIGEPDAAFERTTWARLQPELPARQGPLSWFVGSPARLAWAAAIVLLVTGAFFAGRMMPAEPAAGPEQAATAGQIRERILLIDLSDHLDRSQMVLVELASAGGSDGGADISVERARAEQLVAAGRIYRATASATGDTAIMQLLEELERLLVDVAAGPEHLSAEDLMEVQQRIESQSLLFKVRVLASKVRERQQDVMHERAGQRSAL